ncbi:MAG: EamA family transporter, partial [Gemmatimonadales bacterium]
GLVILIGPATASLGERVDPLGALILLVATISWSIGSVHSRSANLPSSPLLGTGMEMLCGGVLLLMAGAATGEIAAVDPSAVSLRSVVALAYLIVFGALLGFTAYIYLLKAAGPTRAATYAYVNPVVAVFLGWALAGEAITVRTIIASVAIIGAVVLITSAGRGPARLARPFRAVFRKAA